MLLVHPRITLMHLCLAVMQAAWIAPFVLLLDGGRVDAAQVFALILALLLAWMLVLELLSNRLASPAYDAVTLFLMFLTSLLLVRLLLFGNWPVWDFSWVSRIAGAAAHIAEEGGGELPPAFIIVATNLLLWQRATAATSRELTFFGVGLTFRLGMLLLILGGGLYAALRGGELVPFIWVYFAAGLIAISLARIGDKAMEAQSSGSILPPGRFAQVLAAVGITIGLGWLASFAYTPGGIRSFLRLFAPLWKLVEPLLLALLVLIGKLLAPVLLLLERVLTLLLRRPAAAKEAVPLESPQGSPGPLAGLPGWPFELARTILVVMLIAGAILGLLVFLLLYLERVRKVRGRGEAESEQMERPTLGEGLLSQGLDAARRTLRLTRRLGVGRQLLAAISVENMYANLTRIAARHGRPRRPAQPPDDFLPVLQNIFPGEEVPLSRITFAYMRVHYGDHPVRSDELAALRADYRAVRAAEVEKS